MKDTGSAKGIQSYDGQGVKRLCPGSAFVTSRYFHHYVMADIHDIHIHDLRDGCALRGACRARPMNMYGGPLLLGGVAMRWGWDLVWSATISSK